jgi:hypothetical protein
MQITFSIGADKLSFLSTYDERIKIINAEQIEDADVEIYRTTLEVPEHYGIGAIAQLFFYAGASYGLHLDYSSYGTEPSR